MKWRVTAVLILLGLVGCGSSGVTDRERIYCLNMRDQMFADNAEALGFEAELEWNGDYYWFPHDYVVQDEPWFERVCKASIPPGYE